MMMYILNKVACFGLDRGIKEKILKNELEYKEWLVSLKKKIRSSQAKAAFHINSELIQLYWSIGADIVIRQIESKWGKGVITQLSKDIKEEFPESTGFSERNLIYMRSFYNYYSSTEFTQQAVAQLGIEKSAEYLSLPPSECTMIPWGHNIQIFTKSKSYDEAIFYINQTIENGWSRATLLNYMDSNLFEAKGSAPNNYDTMLPDTQSDLAAEILKDPYNFDFLSLTEGYDERELENALTTNITKFLLELGQGFAYVGRQIHINVGGDDFSLDLLFYHIKLRCYVVIELKAGKFSPKDLGQLGFYISAVNHKYKTEEDNSTVGIIVCKEKNNAVAKYALESSAMPIGISEYELSEIIPEDYKSSLPTIEELEKEFSGLIMPEIADK